MNGYCTGFISSTDKQRGRVKVTYPQYDNIVSDWLPLLYCEYNIPEIGAYVAVILDEYGNGVCLGKLFSNNQPPTVCKGYYKKIGNTEITADNNDFKIQFEGDSYIQYKSGTITIKADNVNIIRKEE